MYNIKYTNKAQIDLDTAIAYIAKEIAEYWYMEVTLLSIV